MIRHRSSLKAALALVAAGTLSVALIPVTAAPAGAIWPCGDATEWSPMNPSYIVPGPHGNPRITNPAVMKAVECLIKVERGRGMLVDDALQKAAHGHADAAVNLKWWGMSDPHVNPVTHSTIESRIRAQNFCAGGDLYAGSLTEITYTGSGSRNTPAAAVDWWMHSARDRAIILSKGLYSEGIWAEWGSALDRSDFGSATYVVDFGTCGSGGG